MCLVSNFKYGLDIAIRCLDNPDQPKHVHCWTDKGLGFPERPFLRCPYPAASHDLHQVIGPLNERPKMPAISSYNCRHHGYHSYSHYGGSQASRFDFENYGAERRSDRESYVPGFENERINARSADEYYERPRPSERSIAVDSEIQRVQEEERKRFQDRKREDETGLRTQNGASKVVNIPKIQPTLTNRRGQLEAQDRRPSDDSVVFPGPTSESKVYVPDIPAACKTWKICDNVTNYPSELAARYIAKLGDKRDRFTIDQLDEPMITQRLGAPDQNIELCRFTEKVMIPQAAPAKDGEWYFILNDKTDPLQGYRVEICDRDGGSCANNIAYFNRSYNATCRQKYVQRTMTAIDRAGNIKYDMPFRVPSCCSCVATHLGK